MQPRYATSDPSQLYWTGAGWAMMEDDSTTSLYRGLGQLFASEPAPVYPTEPTNPAYPTYPTDPTYPEPTYPVASDPTPAYPEPYPVAPIDPIIGSEPPIYPSDPTPAYPIEPTYPVASEPPFYPSDPYPVEPPFYPSDPYYPIIDTGGGGGGGPVYDTGGGVFPTTMAPSDGFVERIGDTIGDIIESIGRQLPGIIQPSTPRPPGAPAAPAVNWGTLALIGVGAWLLLRR